MAEVTIEWTQRVSGREKGQIERVERTDYINGVIKNNRAKVLVDHAAADQLFETLAKEAESFPADLHGAVAVEPVVEAAEPDAPVDAVVATDAPEARKRKPVIDTGLNGQD